MNNEKIVEMLDDSGSIEENGLHADKLDLKEKRTIANVPTTRGTYFGGKVNSVQSMVQVTGLTGVYHDAGAYFLANGSSGFSPDYRKTKSFDVAKMKTLQKQTVNRSYYFTTNYGGFVDAKYTAKYKTGGNSYSISVTINA